MPLICRTTQFVDGAVTNYFDLCDLGFTAESCQPVPRPFPVSRLEIESPQELPDWFYAGNMLITSAHMRDILLQYEVKAEFLTLTVKVAGKPYRMKDLFFTNLLDAVPCFDYENSRYDDSDTDVRGITHLVLKTMETGSSQLFLVGPIPSEKAQRPKAIGSIICCASEQLAAAVIRSSLTGVVFVEAQDWRAYPPENVAWTPS